MPRYFFTVHDGRSIIDEDGTELPSFDAAKKEALRYAAQLLADEKEEFWQRHGWHMEVCDGAGLKLLRLDLAATVSPAGESARRPG